MSALAVAVVAAGTGQYPKAPFFPPNPVYAAVEEGFRRLGWDAARAGTREWNPLGGWIRPGMRVLLKPNLVRHYHPGGLSIEALFTHGSVIRAACDYAARALCGRGEIVIADAPLQTCDFNAVCQRSGVAALAGRLGPTGCFVDVRDLRLVRAEAHRTGWWGRVLTRKVNSGDPKGYTVIDLGSHSLHARREAPGRYRVSCYDPAAMEAHHGGGRHAYVIANTLLEADVVINLPKWKTHHKAGLTGALKNFIGVNGHKDCLPHHVQGPAALGGDEYRSDSTLKRLDSRLQDYKESAQGVLGGAAIKKGAGVAHRLLHAIHVREPGNAHWEGSWHGNDTISRTTVDLNRIVRYADQAGRLRNTPQRSVLTIVDGVVAGEGEGPLAPTPKTTGLVVAGANPVAVDLVLARLMGFRWDAIPTLRHAVKRGAHPLFDGEPRDVRAVSNDSLWEGMTCESAGESLKFEPPKGWRGHVEL